jgi:aerobic carbon-monoxide dehydrogenase large subunit
MPCPDPVTIATLPSSLKLFTNLKKKHYVNGCSGIITHIFAKERVSFQNLSSGQTAKLVVREKASAFVGKSLKRREDPSLLTGHGTYVDDIKFPNMLHACFVRSSYGHAKILYVDLEAARRTPGVRLVLSGEEIRKITKPLPLPVPLPWMKKTEVYMLAVDKVHYTGEPVAVVLAEDRYIAEDAAEKIVVDYEPLEAIVDAEDALKTGSPLLYESWGTNEMLSYNFKVGEPMDAFANSDHIISQKITRHRYTAAPMETRGYVANYDPYSKILQYYASVQTPHILRTLLAESLEIPEDKIRVIAPHVGGGFGQKIPLYQEEPVVALLSIKTGLPVKWIESRTENLKAGAHSRQQVHHFEIGVNNDGTITGIRDKMIIDLGAFAPQSGLGSALATTLFIPSGYKIQNYEIDLHVVNTCKAPYGALRGFGKADANYVIERIIDIASRAIGKDPVEVRLKNFIAPDEFPYRSCTGALYDSGNYSGNLLKAAQAIDYWNFKNKQEELRQKGIFKGISVSFMIEPSANAVPDSLHSGYDSATIRIDPSGKISVMAGVAAQGQGHETALSQIVADELGVTPDDVSIFEGDTALSPYGLGAWASRFAIAGVGSVIMACDKIKRKLVKIAAGRLGIPEAELILEEGKIKSIRDSKKEISISEIAKIAYTQIYLLPFGVEPGLEETARYVVPNLQFIPNEKGQMNLYPSESSAAYGVIVSVDKETGKLDIEKQVFVSDCGNIINPINLDGQLVGGIAQGIGGAIFEDLVYDSTGELLASSFLDYLLPTSMEVPEPDILHMVTPSPVTLGGFKGGGEGGCITPPYGLTNAVEDAMKDMQPSFLKQPLSPENVWKAIRLSEKAR